MAKVACLCACIMRVCLSSNKYWHFHRQQCYVHVHVQPWDVASQIQLLGDEVLGTDASAVVVRALWPLRFGESAVMACKLLRNPLDKAAMSTFVHEVNILKNCRWVFFALGAVSKAHELANGWLEAPQQYAVQVQTLVCGTAASSMYLVFQIGCKYA